MKTINADDIRLQEIPFSFEGKVYKLCCNMNVVADVQLQHNGDLMSTITGPSPFYNLLDWLAAMMNNAAEREGWPERITARELGNRISVRQVPVADLMDLIRISLYDQEEDHGGQEEAHGEEDEKN